MSHVGTVYNIAAEPIDREVTDFIPGGVITIGVEMREITTASILESRRATATPSELAEVERQLEEKYPEGLTAGGLSLHVLGAEDGHEYLRFDCFETDPHYHYFPPTAADEPVVNRIVFFDAAACGEPLPWVITALRKRLPGMLAVAAGESLAAQLDDELVERAVQRIEALISERPALREALEHGDIATRSAG